MSNVALYLRYSSSAQNEQSIEGQDRVCTEYCQKNGHTIVYRYIDRATSASKDIEKRTEFLRMIKDAERHQFDAVIVYKLDRFARNRYDSATYKNKLKKAGVKLISATEELSDNPESIILESVLEGMAEFYSKELSQKVMRGMTESAKKCNSVGGSLPLGYKIEGKKYVIDETTAPLVREIFQLYAGGKGITEIAREFNKRGYKTSKGRAFTTNSFHTILSNKRYIGIYKFNGMEIEGGFPPIIEKDLFDKVQRIVERNKTFKAHYKAKDEYILSGKLFCGHCGEMMTGTCATNHQGVLYTYYICKNKTKHTCDKKMVGKEEIERAVAEKVMEIINNEDTIEYLAECAMKAAEEDRRNNSRLDALQAEIKELQAKADNIVSLIEDRLATPTLIDRLYEIENTIKLDKKNLEYEESKVLHITKKQVIDFLRLFLGQNIEDKDFRRTLIEMLVKKVVLWDNPGGYKADIWCRLSDGDDSKVSLTTVDNSPPLQNNPNPVTVAEHFPYIIIRYEKRRGL